MCWILCPISMRVPVDSISVLFVGWSVASKVFCSPTDICLFASSWRSLDGAVVIPLGLGALLPVFLGLFLSSLCCAGCWYLVLLLWVGIVGWRFMLVLLVTSIDRDDVDGMIHSSCVSLLIVAGSSCGGHFFSSTISLLSFHGGWFMLRALFNLLGFGFGWRVNLDTTNCWLVSFLTCVPICCGEPVPFAVLT